MNPVEVAKEFISGLEIGEPVKYRNITVFPLTTKKEGKMDYKVLSEAMDEDAIEITEVSEAGSVPVVKVTNKGDVPVLMIEGQELVGCKQNRVLNTTILVPAKGTIDVPVSCVERGRWSSSGGKFGMGVMSHIALRRMKTEQVGKSLRLKDEYATDQGAIWEEVNKLLSDSGVRSRTQAMHDVLESKGGEMKSFEEILKDLDGNGIAFCVNEDVVVAEVFDNRATFHKIKPHLFAGIALEGLARVDEAYVEPKKEEVMEFLRSIATAIEAEYESPGIGRDIRVRAEDMIGAGFLCKDHVLHLEIFKRTDYRRARRRYTSRESERYYRGHEPTEMRVQQRTEGTEDRSRE